MRSAWRMTKRSMASIIPLFSAASMMPTGDWNRPSSSTRRTSTSKWAPFPARDESGLMLWAKSRRRPSSRFFCNPATHWMERRLCPT